MVYDTLIEQAFMLREPTSTSTPSPTLTYCDLPRPEPVEADAKAVDPIWDEVRQAKARALAAMPSKVKSLEGITMPVVSTTPSRVAAGPEADEGTERLQVSPPRSPPPRLRRKNSATFGESSDGRRTTVSFDMSDVGKQDMHVSFRTNKIIVSWRRVRITEKREDDALIRERTEKQFNQIIPLPEGTSFREVRAARSGTLLVLSFPKSRCVRVDEGDDKRTTIWSSGQTDFGTCISATGSLFEAMEEFTVEKQV